MLHLPTLAQASFSPGSGHVSDRPAPFALPVHGDRPGVFALAQTVLAGLLHEHGLDYASLPKGLLAFHRAAEGPRTACEEHLVDAPIDDYEQITSLLRDGRKHKGVDFKAPVGTPVRATFDGVIVRKNWNFRGNGNSLEVQESGGQGRTALYLHLSEIPKSVKVGDSVKRGQPFAKSGNTGHSFAPHLHYQLMKGATVVDPFESQKTGRQSLPSEDRSGFDGAVARFKALMPAETVAGN